MECLNAEGAWRSLGGEREEDEEESDRLGCPDKHVRDCDGWNRSGKRER